MLKAIGLRVTMGFFFVSALMVLLVSIFVNIQMNRSVSMLTESIQSHLMTAAIAASQYISAEELDLYHTVEDTESPEYQRLKQKLIDFADKYNVLYVYYWRDYGDGLLQYIVDNDTDPEYTVGPWSIYEVEDVALDALSGNNGVTDLGTYTPTWDGLITGYAPVYNDDGSFYCVAGVDLSDEVIYVQRRASQRMMILQIVALAVAVLFGFFNMQLYHKKARQAEQANIKITAAMEAAEQANTAKSRFLATVSHEIRTPISAIVGIAQIQLQQEDLPQKFAPAFKTVSNSGHDLLGIINDLLDLSKIESGKLELHPAVYETAELIHEAVQVNIIRIGSKQIEFILDLDETLPRRLYGDELRLKQILNNLLSNAIKYTQQGWVRLYVGYQGAGQQSAGEQGAEQTIELKFVVADSGQGLKPEDKERLFTEYQRFNAETNRNTEGTGLGLSITKNLVDLMGGSIGVESSYGKGSTFTATVVQGLADETQIGAELAASLRNFSYNEEKEGGPGSFSAEPIPDAKVLLVDDLAMNLFIAKGLMEPYQMTVETADSGFAALDLIKGGQSYDIIFMDHMMPELDGVETTKQLRALGYQGIILALSANTLDDENELFLQNGFDGFIAKPIDEKKLNDALNKFIREQRSAT